MDNLCSEEDGCPWEAPAPWGTPPVKEWCRQFGQQRAPGLSGRGSPGRTESGDCSSTSSRHVVVPHQLGFVLRPDGCGDPDEGIRRTGPLTFGATDDPAAVAAPQNRGPMNRALQTRLLLNPKRHGEDTWQGVGGDRAVRPVSSFGSDAVRYQVNPPAKPEPEGGNPHERARSRQAGHSPPVG